MDFGRTIFHQEEANSAPTERASENAAIVEAQTDFWAGSIRETFKRALETGEILIEAKAALPHGQWLPMLKKAGLCSRKAQIWMEIARNPRFANASPDLLLPPCVTTL